MIRLNRWIRNYFGFSKSQALGFIILLPLVFIIISTPIILRQTMPVEPDLSENRLALDSMIANLEYSVAKAKEKSKYRQYKQSYNQKKYTQAYAFSEPKPLKEVKITRPKRVKFDINKADTSKFKGIYGIGSVLSARIIKYRKLLGGFTTKKQLSEVYGLKPEVLSRLDSATFIEDSFVPGHVEINTDSLRQLAAHPYISWKTAKILANYRYQHGDFEKAEDLYAIEVIDTVTIQKITPYLKF